MKFSKKIIVITSMLFVLGVCILSAEANWKYVFANIVYGSQNTTSKNIIFSKDSGFYDEDFELRIFAPTKEVYYTLDGSDPDQNSTKYSGPIVIRDATENPNVYSIKTNVTAEFLEEEVQKYSKERYRTYYKAPDYNVDKCTVVKVAYYDENGNCSEIEERIFFVDFEEKQGYENVNVISITTDPENLFGYESGIYVLGKTYDDFRANQSMEEFWAAEYWEHWGANYRNKGREWERESHIQVFDTEKNLVLSQNVGIRIQGGASRGFLPKSLNIYARDEYGENRLHYDFFGTGFEPKRVTLTSGGDDFYTKIKDKLTSELAEDTNIVTMNYEPYVLFLNGEYWGFYYLTEKYDEIFIEEYYGVDKGVDSNNIIIIKNHLFENGLEEDVSELYTEAVGFIAAHNMEDEENYQKACELIDINSCIDYFAVLGYVARCGDWPGSNVAMWRSRNISEKSYEDGKWRWMLFDVNSTSLSEDLISHDIIGSLRESSGLFDSLCDNEEFRRMFANRLIELSDTVFEKDYVTQKIDEYIETMEFPMENHYQRFFGTSNEKYLSGVEEIREFFNQRRPYIIDSIKTHFGEEYLGEITQ